MQIGEVVAGRFRLEEKAGSGAMGLVFRGRDLAAQKLVAVKFLLDHDAKSGSESALRFEREAQVLAALKHPNIVGYEAHGVTPRGEAFLVMEWAPGETLRERLTRGPLGVLDALQLAIAISAALTGAHAQGIVHRDLKPANLVFAGGDVATVKLLDFGIARLLKQGSKLTSAGDLLGTPAFMAPEQVRGALDEIDARADVYSLGVILFRCLSGRLPYEATDPLQLLMDRASKRAPAIGSLVSDLPAKFAGLIDAMLSIERERRPRDARAVSIELAAIEAELLCGPAPLGAPAPSLTKPALAPAPTERLTSGSLKPPPAMRPEPQAIDVPAKPRGRSGALIALIALGVLGVGAGAALGAWKMFGAKDVPKTAASTTASATVALVASSGAPKAKPGGAAPPTSASANGAPKVGESCPPPADKLAPTLACDGNHVLGCVDGEWVASGSCEGVRGCDAKSIPVCDGWSSAIGSPCEPNVLACAADGSAILGCSFGRFIASSKCPKSDCAVSLKGPTCSSPIVEPAQPCAPVGARGCIESPSRVMVCPLAQRWALEGMCSSCAATPTDATCQDEAAPTGSACSIYAQIVCDASHRGTVICTGETFVDHENCAGPTGCVMKTDGAHCDGGRAAEGTPCAPGEETCNTAGTARLKCTEGKFKADPSCMFKTCNKDSDSHVTCR